MIPKEKYLSGDGHKKTAAAVSQLLLLCWHRAIFPVRRQTSIFATDELNFRVRNGNGWTLALISTDYVDADSVSFAAAQAPRLIHFIASPLPNTNATLVCVWGLCYSVYITV